MSLLGREERPTTRVGAEPPRLAQMKDARHTSLYDDAWLVAGHQYRDAATPLQPYYPREGGIKVSGQDRYGQEGGRVTASSDCGADGVAKALNNTRCTVCRGCYSPSQSRLEYAGQVGLIKGCINGQTKQY